MRNTGKPTETLFEDSVSALGKAGYFYRITDAAKVRGLTGKIGNMEATPSDYIVTARGLTQFAEVKSTHDEKRFKFSLLKKGQNIHGTRIVAAGGQYNVFVRNMLTDQWYRIPFSVVQLVRKAGAQSLTWDQMEDYKWDKRWTT